MRDGVFRRSNEFLFKDKRLKNAQPNLEDADGSMRRAPSKNPKLHKIRQRQENKKRRREREINGEDEVLIDEEEEEEADGTFMGKMMKQFNKKSSVGTEEITPGADLKLVKNASVSPERKKTILNAMSDIVQARLAKSRSVNEAPRNSIVRITSDSNIMNDPDMALTKKFSDMLYEQQTLINFHKS